MRPPVRFGLLAALAVLAVSSFGPTVEVLVVLYLLLLLVLRELVGRDLSQRERARVDLLVGAGVVAFAVVVVRRVAEILS